MNYRKFFKKKPEKYLNFFQKCIRIQEKIRLIFSRSQIHESLSNRQRSVIRFIEKALMKTTFGKFSANSYQTVLYLLDEI